MSTVGKETARETDLAALSPGTADLDPDPLAQVRLEGTQDEPRQIFHQAFGTCLYSPVFTPGRLSWARLWTPEGSVGTVPWFCLGPSSIPGPHLLSHRGPADGDSRGRGTCIQCLPKCVAQARQGLVLTGLSELLTRADTAGKEEPCGERNRRWGAVALLPAAQGSTLPSGPFRSTCTLPLASQARAEAQEVGELGTQQLHSPWHPSP